MNPHVDTPGHGTDDPVAVAEPLDPGRELLAGYRVDEHLLRGRVNDVYSAWSSERRCLCVVKLLRPDRSDDTAARGRLLAEGRLLESLSHPHLVRAYATVGAPAPAVVLETLTGQTLGHLISGRRRALAPEDLLELGLQLTTVLGYLHRSGVLHLDLKPSNIVVEAGRAKILDLGHARAPGTCPAGFGTREYMPPEQLMGGEVGEASDVYGLGGVLYRAATRTRPFPEGDRGPDTDAVPPMAPLHRRRALPAELITLVAACLQPRAADRPTLRDVEAGLKSARRNRPAHSCPARA